jgi:integrase
MPVFKRRERKRNPWCYRFWIDKDLHKECGFRTMREALEAERREKDRLSKLTTHMAFLTAVNNRLNVLQGYATPGHYRDNRSMLARFPEWDHLTLPELTPQIVRDKILIMAKSLGNANANRHLRALRAVFELAVNDGHLLRNPCRGLKEFPVDKPVKFVPSKEQIALVLLRATPLDQAYLTLIYDTAARVREINYLPWADDVDLQMTPQAPHGRVRLWTRKKKGGNRTPRWVPLSAKGRTALEYAWRHRDKTSSYVFTNPKTGKPYNYRDKFFDRLCRLAGIPEMGFHALRHARASDMADARLPLHYIRDFLGHADIATTSKYLKSLGRGE